MYKDWNIRPDHCLVLHVDKIDAREWAIESLSAEQWVNGSQGETVHSLTLTIFGKVEEKRR